MNLFLALGRALDAERGVLVRHDVVFVFGVQRLEMLWYKDFLVGQLVVGLGEVLEEVGVVRGVEVEVRRIGVARLWLLAGA